MSSIWYNEINSPLTYVLYISHLSIITLINPCIHVISVFFVLHYRFRFRSSADFLYLRIQFTLKLGL